MNRRTIHRNPFSTCLIRPGAIAWIGNGDCGEGASNRFLDRLLERFDRLGRVVAIVGPHGSGKSTLLTHLADRIRSRGSRVERVQIRERWDIWRCCRAILTAGEATVLVDGWECLGGPGRLLRWLARMVGARLIVTQHQVDRTAVLHRCRPTPRLFRRVVEQLLGGQAGAGMQTDHDTLREVYDRHHGNIREALFELYDWHERRMMAEEHRAGLHRSRRICGQRTENS